MDSPFSFIALFFLCFSLIACSPTPDDSKQLADNIRVRHSFLNAAAIKMAAEKGTDTTVKKEDAIKELSWPNDVYKLKSTDGTLNFETDAHGVRLKDVNYADTDKVFGALDGWSVSAPMVIHLNVPDHKQFDPSTISGDSVRIYEISLRGPLAEQPECRTGSNMHICTNQEITRHTFVAPEDITYETSDDYNTSYTVHYVEGKNKLEIKPIAPLKQASSYLIVLTSALKDTEGNPLRGSIDFELMQKPESMNPKLDDIQAMLQNHVHIIANHENESPKNIIYTAHFSTLSSNTTFKHIMAKMLEDTKKKTGDYKVALRDPESKQFIIGSTILGTCKSNNTFTCEDGINGLDDVSSQFQDFKRGVKLLVGKTEVLTEKVHLGPSFVSKELKKTNLYLATLERPSFSKKIVDKTSTLAKKESWHIDCTSSLIEQPANDIFKQISNRADHAELFSDIQTKSKNTDNPVDFNKIINLKEQLSNKPVEIENAHKIHIPLTAERYDYKDEVIEDTNGIYDKDGQLIKYYDIENKFNKANNELIQLNDELIQLQDALTTLNDELTQLESKKQKVAPKPENRYSKFIILYQDDDGKLDKDGNEYPNFDIIEEFDEKIDDKTDDIDDKKEEIKDKTDDITDTEQEIKDFETTLNGIDKTSLPNKRFRKTGNDILVQDNQGEYDQKGNFHDYTTEQEKQEVIKDLIDEQKQLTLDIDAEIKKQEMQFEKFLEEQHEFSFKDFKIKHISQIEACQSNFETQWQASSTSLASLVHTYRQLSTNERASFVNQIKEQTGGAIDCSEINQHSSYEAVKKFKQKLSWWGAENGYPSLTYNGQKIDDDQLMTRFNPLPRVAHTTSLDVLITTPQTAVPTEGWPLVILVHGITSRKEDNFLLTKAYTDKGIATISIDLPLHGSRGIDLDEDGTNDITTTRYGEPNYSSLAFMYLKNMLTARDNLRQSMVDILALRLAISELENGQLGTLKFDKSNIGLQAFSLGAIISTSVLAHSGHDLSEFFDDNTTTFNKDDSPFKFDAGVLVAPAMGLAGMLINSPEFKDDIIPSIKEIWEENNTTNARWEDEKSDAIETFLLLSQALVDVGEPTSSVHDLQKLMPTQDEPEKGMPLLMIEIEGDETIGNNVITTKNMDNSPHTFMPSSGTSPLFPLFRLEVNNKNINTTTTLNQLELDICNSTACNNRDFSFGIRVEDRKANPKMKLSHTSLLNYSGYTHESESGKIWKPLPRKVNYQETHTKALQDIVTGYFKTFFDGTNTITITNDSLVINP